MSYQPRDVYSFADQRYKARTDLYYLGTEVLGYDFVSSVHEPVTEFFVRKDPDKPLFEQDTTRARLLLDPRGHFKTTIDVCDIVQWILCFPDIRILIVSGSLELSRRILAEVGHHFVANEKLSQLFPEFVLDPKRLLKSEFTIPCRKNKRLREPTVTIATVNATKAGSHYDIIKFDDVVNEINSKTPEQLQETIDDFNALTPLLEPLGYRDVIGTRYNYSDLYGFILDNNNDKWKTFQRAACTLPLTEESTILFEKDGKGNPRFSYKLLRAIQRDDPYLFNCQYLNDPTPIEDTRFTEKLLLAQSLPDTAIPYFTRTLDGNLVRTGKVFICWDLAFSRRKHADFSSGAVGLYDALGRLYVVDLSFGRFSPDELVLEIVAQVLKWKPFLQKISIENASGSELLSPALNDMARKLQLHMPIEWVPTHPDNRKKERIWALLPLLKQKRLFFNSAISNKEELVRQFVRFPHYKHDDIPDSISMLVADAAAIDTIQTIQQPITEQLDPYVIPGCEAIGGYLVG